VLACGFAHQLFAIDVSPVSVTTYYPRVPSCRASSSRSMAISNRACLYWLVTNALRSHHAVDQSRPGAVPEPVGELALDLGATAAQVLDRREMFLREFALPILQANASIKRIASWARSGALRHRPGAGAPGPRGGCDVVATPPQQGNDQFAWRPRLPPDRAQVLARCVNGTQKPEDKSSTPESATSRSTTGHERFQVDRNWGVSLYVSDLADAWQEPPAEAYSSPRPSSRRRAEPAVLTIGFDRRPREPCRPGAGAVAARAFESCSAANMHCQRRRRGPAVCIRAASSTKAPTPTILVDGASRPAKPGADARDDPAPRTPGPALRGTRLHGHCSTTQHALQGFFNETQKHVTGEVRLKLYKGRAPSGAGAVRIASTTAGCESVEPGAVRQ